MRLAVYKSGEIDNNHTRDAHRPCHGVPPRRRRSCCHGARVIQTALPHGWKVAYEQFTLKGRFGEVPQCFVGLRGNL